MHRVALWIFALCSPAPLAAQAITAKVIGTVTDPWGAVVPAAALTLRNQQTTQTRQAKSDTLGNYEFSFVPVGAYTLAVTAAGFQRAEVRQPDTFGRVTSTVQGAAGMPGDARVIQFGLKLLF